MNLRDLLQQKRLAYIRTFCGENGRPHPEALRVLADLKRFCRVNRGGIVVSPVTRMVDPHATAYAAGLRDAYLRIAGMIDLEDLQTTEEDNRVGTEHALE